MTTQPPSSPSEESASLGGGAEAREPNADRIAGVTRQVLARVLRAPTETLSPQARLFLDLRLTSANALELLMLLEDELDLDLKAHEVSWRELETLADLTRYVSRRAEAGGRSSRRRPTASVAPAAGGPEGRPATGAG
jgi:acyl carrier protein